jgi:heterodisulfide reductase subunit B
MKNIPLQIESELTRRATSLKAVVFYATHLTLIEEIILPFDPDLFRLHQQRKF